MGIFELSGFFGVLWILLIIFASVRTVQSKAGDLAKAIWIAVLLFFPIIGLILWLFFGPRRA